MKKIALSLILLFTFPFIASANVKENSVVYSLNKASHLTAKGESNINNTNFFINGSLVANNLRFRALSVAGPTQLAQVAVEDLTVRGKADLVQTKVDKLFIEGDAAMLDEVTVSNEAIVIGKLHAVSTSFKRLLTLTTSHSTLANSTAVNIVVKKAEGPSEKIYLKNNTVIKGSITFESGTGWVFLSNGSKVMGKIIGGQIAE